MRAEQGFGHDGQVQLHQNEGKPEEKLRQAGPSAELTKGEPALPKGGWLAHVWQMAIKGQLVPALQLAKTLSEEHRPATTSSPRSLGGPSSGQNMLARLWQCARCLTLGL